VEKRDADLAKKALQIGRISATGGLKLFAAKITSTAIMATGSIILARLILPEEYGLYSIALIPSLTLNLFHDWGIGSAMTKYVAQYRVTNNEDEIRDIVKVGLMFKAGIGLGLSFLSLFLASFIASTVFHRLDSMTLISVASVAIISDSLFTVSQACFVGFERMDLNGWTMICQSILKSALSPILVLLGYGALGATLGNVVALLFAAILSVLMLYFLLFKNLGRAGAHRPGKSQVIKTMLRFGVPLSVSTILGGIITKFYGFMIAFYCTDTIIGNYQVAVNFAILLTFFTFPIATVLFPAFAKLDPANEPALLKTVFASAVKYTALLLVPATMAIMVLSKPMVSTLFGEKWIYAPFFLTLYVIPFLFVVFGDTAIHSLLSGLGQTRTLMKMSILTILFGIPLALILVPALGVTGAILGSMLAGLPSLLFGLRWIWKSYGARADFSNSARIALASFIAAGISYLSISFFNAAEWLRLVLGATTYLVTYVVVAPLIGAIRQDDIKTLRAMFATSQAMSKIIDLPLKAMEAIAEVGPAARAARIRSN
jgi:O-antigen/teichoic acid export membrane protein